MTAGEWAKFDARESQQPLAFESPDESAYSLSKMALTASPRTFSGPLAVLQTLQDALNAGSTRVHRLVLASADSSQKCEPLMGISLMASVDAAVVGARLDESNESSAENGAAAEDAALEAVTRGGDFITVKRELTWQAAAKVVVSESKVATAEQPVRACFRVEEAKTDKHKRRVLCTQLNSDPTFQRFVKYYTATYLDRYYYWVVYDIGRRLAQTGLVVVVKIATGSEVLADYYALAVAIVALAVHCGAWPFWDHGDDMLEATFQLHTLLVLFFAVASSSLGDGWDKSAMDGIASVVLGGFVIYLIYVIAPGIWSLLKEFTSVISGLSGRRAVGSGDDDDTCGSTSDGPDSQAASGSAADGGGEDWSELC